jgi:hypothetical protein
MDANTSNLVIDDRKNAWEEMPCITANIENHVDAHDASDPLIL